MLAVAVSPVPTQLFQDEFGVTLTFEIKLYGLPLDITYATVTLEVDGNPNSPFTLTPTTNIGEAKYVTKSGDFSAQGSPTWQYPAHVKFVDAYDEFLSDEFSIYAVLKPTLNL